MADGEKADTPAKAQTGTTNPESPTTARPLDFDDEPQETGVTPTTSAPVNKPLPPLATGDEGAPPKPPRPLSPQQQAEKELKDAFPTIDNSVIKAVLVASGGNLERAFHALLGMTDPNAQNEFPPAKPPRPTSTTTSQRQLEEDELYARQLAEHYSGSEQSRGYPQSHDPRLPRSQRETGLKPNELYDDREHNFFDDDLPVIKENIRQGFLETQSKVNSWVLNFKKQLDGEESEDEDRNGRTRPPQGYDQFDEHANYRTRRSAEARRSNDRERYDADPQILSDNFSSLEMRDNEAPPARPARPQANPDLFKPKSESPDPRKVSFQEGPPEEINDRHSAGSGSNNRISSSGPKSSKWQPLSAVEPSPIGDNDPFSLGDSDDEKETKNKDHKDLKPEEAERVRKATEEAMAGEIGPDTKAEGQDKTANTSGS